MSRKNKAFTIIELIIVMAVISILATLVYVGYSNVKLNAIKTSVTSDLDNAADVLEVFQFQKGQYPDTIDCSIPDSATNICIRYGANTTLNYVPNNSVTPDQYYLSATNQSVVYKIFGVAGSAVPTPVDNNTAVITCPSNYIWVPGSLTYKTGDFCVMKYEAKNVGGVATSQIALTPWMNITQISAASVSSAACAGCHLITEAEWMTIVQNVLGVSSNWSSGKVGTGYIYVGHGDGSPANTLDASADDNNGYYGTGNASGDQRRTLTLSNGQVIWDLAGNAMEWTSGVIDVGNQPSPSGSAYREWNQVSGGVFAVNPYPSGTGISGASSWTNAANEIGLVNSNSADTIQKGFNRGGSYSWHNPGVLSLCLCTAPTGSDAFVLGFRVAK